MARRIGVGFVGCGFIAECHARSWTGVRDGDIVAVTSRTRKSAESMANLCRKLQVGEPAVCDSVAQLVRLPEVDAVWITAPNHERLPIIETIVDEVKSGRSRVRAVAIEKPLARNVKEAERLIELVESVELLHGYLENQVFAPSLVRGKEIAWKRGAGIAGPPYLTRASEEHSGPHRPWFWRGPLQGGGVLSDMMCHSLEAGRFLLTPPDKPDFLRPVAVTATIGSLKWSRPAYARQLNEESNGEVDYLKVPAEDYATAEIVYETTDGDLVIAQANTSWSYVGPGLRLTFELLGPEYSLSINTLEPGSQIFFSRNITGPAGEDLVEKQAAEQGQMPYLGDEAHTYGYTHENQHMTAAFARGEMPRETLHDGLLVSKLLMTAYKSAELGISVKFPPEGLSEFVPLVQRDRWHPRQLVERAK